MKRSTWWIVAGIISVIGGVLALFNPFAGSLAVEFIATASFLLVGIVQLIAVFTTPGAGNKVLLGLVGALSTYLGITLFSNPLEGVLTLTLAVAFLLIASGLFRLFASFDFRGSGMFWALLLSSIISIALGVMILTNFPASAVGMLGIFLGVELVFDGVWLIGLGNTAKSVANRFGA